MREPFPELLSKSHKSKLCGNVDLRQSPIEDTHAELQGPEKERVERPADHLGLRAADSKGIFLRHRVQACSLSRCHAVVGKTSPPSSHDVCRGRLEGVDDLYTVMRGTKPVGSARLTAASSIT